MCDVCELLIGRGKAGEERQDAAGSLRSDEGDDADSKEGAQGPWKPVPAVTAPSPPAKPVPVPEPGTSDSLITQQKPI